MDNAADSSTDDEELALVTVRVVLEGVGAEVLGMNPAQPEPNELVSFCSAVIGTVAPEPEAVALVITGDFLESVKSRLPEGEYRDSFSLERGAGMVGGKTMAVGEETHVLLHAYMFADPDWADASLPKDEADALRETLAERAKLARRTAVHEAQHVAMDQAGEGDVDFSAEAWARQNFLSVARDVIIEYRAELGVPTMLRSDGDAELSVENLTVLRNDLRRIATIDYQQHLDVAKLSFDVGQQTLHLWKLLGYIAAARRVGGLPVGAPFASSLVGTEEWGLMVAAFWDRFEELLVHVPPARERLQPGDLKRWSNALADLFTEWLESYGFTWRDRGEESEFLITSWHLVDY